MTNQTDVRFREEEEIYRERFKDQGWSRHSPVKVLVAEDNDEMRKLLARSLRKDGYEVKEACDGFEVMKFISAFAFDGEEKKQVPPPDLIVSDVRMPGMNGLEILEALREVDWSIPVILITAFGDREVHKEAERLGALTVIDKPFDIYDFRSMILKGFPPM